MGDRIGYARVSTHSQKEDTQVADLEADGCSRIFVDHGVSGKHASRPELDKCLDFMRAGDTFTITRLSRAMRSLRHMLELAETLKARDINLRVIKQAIDTSTPHGRLTFHVLAAVDEFQREIIVEGTVEGLIVARANGKFGGRPLALDESGARAAKALYDAIGPDGRRQFTVADICRKLDISKPTLYRAMARLEQGGDAAR